MINKKKSLTLSAKEAAERYYYLQEYLLFFGLQVKWEENRYKTSSRFPIWEKIPETNLACPRCSIAEDKLRFIENNGRCQQCRFSPKDAIKRGLTMLGSDYERV